ncbi:MAG: YCF48-related protein [Gemmatimonadota bacterium]|nr:YCF48-related protein [Gemmatimonadota bacterium]
MKLHRYFFLFLIVGLFLVPATGIEAQKKVAGGEVLNRKNRLISTMSETGKRFYRPVAANSGAFSATVPDGRAGEAYWKQAQPVGPFIEDNSRQIRDCTARVAYDRENIYLFFEIETAAAPVAAVSLADTALDSDSYFQVDIHPVLPDTMRYGRGYYYSLAVNPAGTVWDAYYDPYQEGYFFTSWNSGAQVAATSSEKGWTAEIRIPFSGIDLYSDAGWSWILEFHQSEKGLVASAVSGIRVTQGADVRRPAWVTYYWDRPELMPELQPNARTMFHKQRSITVAGIQQPPIVNRRPDSKLFAETGEVALLLRDDTAEPVGRGSEGSFKVACNRESICFQFKASSGRVKPKDKRAGQDGTGMARQMAGVNGVYMDLELLSREGFWVLLQPRDPQRDAVHQGAYFITFDNSGQVKGTYYDGDGIPHRDWDPGARIDVYDTPEGWGAELTVPVSAMEVPAGCGTSWGLNVWRNAADPVNGNNELAAWCPTRSHHHDTGHSGSLEGIEISIEAQVKKSLEKRLARLESSIRKLDKNYRKQAKTIRSDARAIRGKIRTGDPERIARRIEALEQRLGQVKAARYYATQPRPPSAGHRLLDICMVPGTGLGWAVGRQGVILHTADGGRSWRPQASGTNADLQRVQFIDEKQGWIAGGRVRMGRTNEEMRHDERGGYGYILHTGDGGRNWEIQYGEQGRYIFGLYILNGKQGWAVGERGVILHTTDSGTHWRVTANSGTVNWLYGISFLEDGRRGFIVGETQTVLATDDSGKHWRKVDAPADKAFYGFLPHYRSVTFRGEDGWIVGQNGIILGTGDGGKTWQVQSEVFTGQVRELLDLERVHFADSKHGLAAGRLGTRVMATDDGGASWRLVPVPNRAPLSGVWLEDDGRALLAGAMGSILVSGDSGRSWNSVHGSEAKLDALALMAHGDDGPIMFGAIYAYYALVEGRKIGDIQFQRDAHSIEYQGEIYNLEHHRCINLSGLVVADYMDETENGNNGCDYYHYTQRCWEDETAAIRRMVYLIRTFRPEVVLTHEPVYGDYDKPGHKLAGRAALAAFESSGGEVDQWPELTRLGLPPWQPKKLYCGAGESYPETLDLSGLMEKKVKDGLTAVDWGNIAIRCFQSQGVYHVRGAHLSLMRSLVPVPDQEQSIFDGLE